MKLSCDNSMDFKPKLVAFDLDGTLAESKARVTVPMGELLGELLQLMPVAVLSGGGYPQYEEQLLSALPQEAKFERLYLFPDSAAICYRHNTGVWKTEYDENFTSMERAQIMQALDISMKETGFAEPPSPVWGERIEDRGAEITFSALGQHAPAEEKQKWDPTREKRRPLYDALVRRLPDFSIGLNASTSIDITRKGVNKAYGIRKLAGFTGISVSEMLYVGDALTEGGNDAVVIETGIRTHEVFGPDETQKVIEAILHQHKVTQ